MYPRQQILKYTTYVYAKMCVLTISIIIESHIDIGKELSWHALDLMLDIYYLLKNELSLK